MAPRTNGFMKHAFLLILWVLKWVVQLKSPHPNEFLKELDSGGLT